MKKDKLSLAPWNIKASTFPKNGKMESKLKFLIRYAILAPSGHNTQPWKFEINDRIVKILPDFDRQRTAVDPENRELFISLGCASKNLEIAANYFGMIFEKEIIADYKQGEAAVVFEFKNGKTTSNNRELFESITKRWTDRSEYLRNGVEPELIDKVDKTESENAWVRLVDKDTEKTELAKLVYKSNLVWFRSKELLTELEGWIRDDVENSKDGLPTGVLNLYKVASTVKYYLSKDSEIAMSRAERDRYLAQTAPVLAVVATKMDGVKHWVEAGEVYEEAALKLASQGVSNSFFNTVVELKGQRLKLAEILKIKGKPQLMLRIGKSEAKIKLSPRRPLEDVLVSSR